MIESRRHSGEMTPADSLELEQLVFDLVREQLLTALGAGGMWTVQFRTEADTDALFGEMISEHIARGIAKQIAAPAETASETVAEIETEEPLIEEPVEEQFEMADADTELYETRHAA